jgi:hypothetical protein
MFDERRDESEVSPRVVLVFEDSAASEMLVSNQHTHRTVQEPRKLWIKTKRQFYLAWDMLAHIQQ